MSMRITRRTFLVSAALAAIPVPAFAQPTPVKLGLLTVKTGPLAAGGIQMEQGTIRFLKDRNHTLAASAAKDLKFKSGIPLADDFAFGHEQMAGFQRVFEDAGGRVVKKLWPPLVTPDYTPYLAQISGVDAIVQGFAGSNPLKFMKQYRDAGLKLPVLAGAPAGDDALLKSFGDEAIGMISSNFYTNDLDAPSNKRLIDGMVRDYANIPGTYSAGLYINGMVAEAALEKTGGKTDDREAFVKALRAVALTDTPRGPFHFDHLGNVVGSFYIRRCEKKGDKLVNTTIKSYAKVSQFWTYDEKWFLSQPVYSRDYPPLKS